MILCSGAFDGLHAGHVAYLQAAGSHRIQRESLIVALAPDAYIRQIKLRDPYWTLADRLHVVQALLCVTGVVEHGIEGVADVVRKLSPRLLVKGADWRDHVTSDVRAACLDVGTTILFVDTERRHTSQAFARLVQ